ncbi:MAG: hypothetical protein JWN57_2861 [Frankiales bacterium]|nr:hypothetical protein [Frankiales bacterium]
MNYVTTAVAAVVGVVLAGITAFGIVTSANADPQPVDEPLVTYGQR